MSIVSLEREVGDLRGTVDALERAVYVMQDDVRAIRSAVDQAAGSWKLLLGLAAISSAFGGFATWLVGQLGHR